MGALIGAKLGKWVMSVFKLSKNKVHYWTDSYIVFHWINSTSSTWKHFVSNRVLEIKTLTNSMSWQHYYGSSNPADRLSRGRSLLELERDDIWWSGLSWLFKDSKIWPKEDRELDEDMKRPEAERNVIFQNVHPNTRNHL